MSWDKKARGGRYYYRCKRVDGRPIKVYVGKGPEAEQAARSDTLLNHQKEVVRQAYRDEVIQLAIADQALKDFGTFMTLLSQSFMLIAGHHSHHGEWRRRRAL
jgi:hypothetical protein